MRPLPLFKPSMRKCSHSYRFSPNGFLQRLAEQSHIFGLFLLGLKIHKRGKLDA